MTIDKMHMFRSETSLLFHLNIKSERDKIPGHHHYYCHSFLITIVKLLKLPFLMGFVSYIKEAFNHSISTVCGQNMDQTGLEEWIRSKWVEMPVIFW